jgi:hypothetical protein
VIIVQHLCSCSQRDGFGRFGDTDMWVCGACGLPAAMFYLSYRKRHQLVEHRPQPMITSARGRTSNLRGAQQLRTAVH